MCRMQFLPERVRLCSPSLSAVMWTGCCSPVVCQLDFAVVTCALQTSASSECHFSIPPAAFYANLLFISLLIYLLIDSGSSGTRLLPCSK